ncbi:MAG TPA: acyl carrier protein [Candidatus Paceibacterota bacterium]
MKNFNTIVATHFKIKEDEVRDSLTSNDVLDWDSMNYLLFIAELEKEYGVSFSMDEVLSATSLGALRGFLVAKGVAV